MTDAVAQTVDYAFGSVGLHRVEANIQPGNTPLAGARRATGIRVGGVLTAVPLHRRRLEGPRTLGGAERGLVPATCLERGLK